MATGSGPAMPEQPPVAEGRTVAYGAAVIIEDPASLDLEQSQPAIYDRPVGLRLLYRDPSSGAEHYVVRYSAALLAQPHRHTAAHTIVVLSGRLEANGQVVGPGGYCHFPAGEVMHHAPADGEPCVFIIIFHGPFDVEPAHRA